MGFMAPIVRPLLPNIRKLLVTAAALTCTVTRNATLWPQIRSQKWNRGKGVPSMAAGDEAAAAILVQTIFLKDGHLQGLLGEQANKSPLAAAEFLKPFYRAVLAMVAKAKLDDAK